MDFKTIKGKKHYLFDNNVLIRPFNPNNSKMEPRIVNLIAKAENFPEWMRNEVAEVEKGIINDLLHHSIVDDVLKDNRIKELEALQRAANAEALQKAAPKEDESAD